MTSTADQFLDRTGETDGIMKETAPAVVPEVYDLGLAASAVAYDKNTSTNYSPIQPTHTPLHRQFFWLIWKNLLVMSRRPAMVFFMLFSSVCSVLLAWPAGRDVDASLYPDSSKFDQCGTIPEYILQEEFEGSYWYDDEVIFNLNQSWNSGLSVAVLSLGPFVHAVCVFFLLHFEIEKQLFGVIRGLGIRDIVYWASWYIPLLLTSFFNALFGAITAQFLPVHIFQNVYFGGIFGSIFFLHLGLTSASFFLAAVCGKNNKLMVVLIIVMSIAVFIPCFVNNTVGDSYMRSTSDDYPDYDFSGLTWTNYNTNQTRYAADYQNYTSIWNATTNRYEYIYGDYILEDLGSCNNPVMSEEEGTKLKTAQQSYDTSPDDFFIGCYFQPGFTSAMWSPESTAGFVALYMFPYFHLISIYSNFVGYSGHPGKTFTSKQANMSPEDLAVSLLPTPPDNSLSLGTTLFPQGSTLRVKYYYYWDDPLYRSMYHHENNYDLLTCPNYNRTEYSICNRDFCNYADKSKPLTASPSVHKLFGHLVFVSIIYACMACVWLQLLPAGNGKRKRLFLSFRSKKIENGEIDKDRLQTISIDNVSKDYGSCKAVKNMTLQLKKGEITALLGHNGAGKSTLSNILSCETDPTSGEVSIFGKAVVHDPFDIRRLMAICKQDDFLWPSLTVKEHLDIFAGLRGVAPDQHDAIVQKWLESVDLIINQHTNTSSLSGGMKRRLSLALSTIGDRPFIILDEPTTGMDPVSRRFIWKHLDEIKEDKVILLTTHAMEEADLLADEVAIMKKGELAALGSPLELKAAHGSAIQFTLLVDKEKIEETKMTINNIFCNNPGQIVIVCGDSGNITVSITSVKTHSTYGDEEGVDVSTLAHFVEWLEKESNDVHEYGFSNSSLEDVFINITKDDENTENIPTAHPVSNQDDQVNEEMEVNIDQTAIDLEEHESTSLIRVQPQLSVMTQVIALVRFYFTRKWTGRRSIFEYVFFSIFVIAAILFGLGVTTFRDDFISILFVPLLQVIIIGGLSFLLVSNVFPLYQDKSNGLFHLMRTQGLFHNSYIAGTALYSLTVTFVYGFILVTVLFATPLFRETKLCDFYSHQLDDDFYGISVEDFEQEHNREPFICDAYWTYQSEPYGKVHQSTGHGTTLFIDGVEAIINTADTPGGYWQIIVVPLIMAISMPGATFLSSTVPGNYKFAMTVVGFCTVLAFVFPIVFQLVLDQRVISRSYSYYNDDGQQDNMIKSCYELLNPAGICSDLSLAIEQQNISQEQFLNCIAIRNYGMMGFYGSFCAPAYVSLLPQYGALQIMAFTMFSKIKFWPESMTAFRTIFPIDEGFCSGDICSVPAVQKAYRSNLLFFFLGAVILNVVGLSIFMIKLFPTPFISIVINFFYKLVSSLSLKTQDSVNEDVEVTKNEEVLEEERRVVESLALFTTTTSSPVEGSLIVDHIKRDYYSSDIPPILMHDLQKVYPRAGRSPPKTALQGLSLQIAKGEICGLLGKNGSGKTTALKILSCDHDATSGIALVEGYDVSCEKIKVFESLGNCPQFDVVWPSLSVGEHLEFFARLKGFAAKEVLSVSQSMAKAVGLGSKEVYRKRASALSGGMRRRLTIAIALLGAPGILLCDEPTTGLDPNTRNNLWNLMTSFATRDRAIIITTHMMIEADTLCNRIAIIGQGKLRVVATQQHLKDKYGAGYVLQLNLIKSSLENQTKAMNFVKKYLHEEAILSHRQAKTLHVHLPKGIDLTNIFTKLYSPERITEGCINQFLLSQSSLEDVFLALGD